MSLQRVSSTVQHCLANRKDLPRETMFVLHRLVQDALRTLLADQVIPAAVVLHGFMLALCRSLSLNCRNGVLLPTSETSSIAQ
jgi:hypothetical protein